jgi:hypothetical protein
MIEFSAEFKGEELSKLLDALSSKALQSRLVGHVGNYILNTSEEAFDRQRAYNKAGTPWRPLADSTIASKIRRQRQTTAV